MLQQIIKRAAVRFSVLCFFVMAAVGWWSGVEPSTNGGRALTGAAATYVVVRLAGKLLERILIGALVDDQIRRRQSKEKKE